MWILVSPQFAVVSPCYKSSSVKINGAVSIAATNGGSGGPSPPGYDRYFQGVNTQSKRAPYATATIIYDEGSSDEICLLFDRQK